MASKRTFWSVIFALALAAVLAVPESAQAQRYRGGYYRGGPYYGGGYYRGYRYWGGYPYVYPYYTYPYYAPPVYVPPVYAPPVYSPPVYSAPIVVNLPMTLQVSLPSPSAQVWVDGNPTSQMGTFRTYVSPPMTPGVVHLYTVRAVWSDGVQSYDQTRTVQIQAGQTVAVSFTGTAGY